MRIVPFAFVLSIAAPVLAGETDRLLDAMRQVESGGNPDAVGDGGASRGPYQIQRAYWEDSRVPGRYEQVRDDAYARRVVRAYWQRYCPGAVERGDMETLARVHNGGPAGARKSATLAYWHKVRRAMETE